MFARSILVLAVIPLLVSASKHSQTHKHRHLSRSSSACANTYTIQEGDYCDAISAAQNVSTYQLIALNTDKVMDDCDNLQSGQTLCLATTAANENCGTTYVVQPGDTCDQIVQTYSISDLSILTQNNPQVGDDCEIYIGEVLCVANDVAIPPLDTTVASSIASSVAANPTGSSSTDLPFC
jgi:LysM repeat protein